jgi:ABC-type multidrug transport system fused ATPase/permease subunit
MGCYTAARHRAGNDNLAPRDCLQLLLSGDDGTDLADRRQSTLSATTAPQDFAQTRMVMMQEDKTTDRSQVGTVTTRPRSNATDQPRSSATDQSGSTATDRPADGGVTDSGSVTGRSPDQGGAYLMPRSLRGFIWQSSGWHQLGLCLLSVCLFLLSTAPLELQRRIVNDIVVGGQIHPILLLCALYAGLTVAEGLVKLTLNLYGSWVSETAVLELRRRIAKLSMLVSEAMATRLARQPITAPMLAETESDELPDEQAKIEGMETSLILSEVEPVGGFIGISVMQPLLQGGILISVFGYLVFLDPKMALLNLAVFAPQLIFVPLMQSAINRRAKWRIATLRAVSGGVIAPSHERLGGEVDQVEADAVTEIGQAGRVDHIYHLNMGIYKLKFSMNFLMNLMYHFGVVGVLAIGGWFVIKGETELGTVMAFVSGLAKVNDPWGDIVDWFREMTVTKVKYVMIRDAADWLYNCHRQGIDQETGIA